ncbi:MAG: Flp family type IVb pilin [Isosphaeraceae bacterium]
MSVYFDRMRRFLASEDGPTAVEYAVMLALIVVVCVGILQSLGTTISGTFSSVQSAVSS